LIGVTAVFFSPKFFAGFFVLFPPLRGPPLRENCEDHVPFPFLTRQLSDPHPGDSHFFRWLLVTEIRVLFEDSSPGGTLFPFLFPGLKSFSFLTDWADIGISPPNLSFSGMGLFPHFIFRKVRAPFPPISLFLYCAFFFLSRMRTHMGTFKCTRRFPSSVHLSPSP